MHPMIAQAQVDAVSSQLADLEAELREYEAIREGGFEVEALRVVTDLPELLIKARISQGITQRELANRLGLKEQQIQRYEATDYARQNGPASGRWRVRSAWSSVVPPRLWRPTTEACSVGVQNGPIDATITRSTCGGRPDRLAEQSTAT